MRKPEWKKKIIQQMQAVGTYREAFLPTVDALAGLLEQRDRTHAEFTASGGKSTIEKTGCNGQVSIVKNPLLDAWEDLTKTALTYWSQLGLTPAGLKKIDEAAMKPRKQSALADALRTLEG